jgi:uncharacterized protein (DUF427 family)
MALRLREAFVRARGELRYEPTEKRVRAMLGDHTVADSTSALLLWEPRRILPSYAFPAGEVDAELVPSAAAPAEDAADIELLHGGHPFELHSTPGEALDVRAGGETRDGAAFRPADPDLAGYVVLDFHAFDPWYEEDEPIVGHPRDPFHRVDVRRGSRHVRIELDGQVLAESSRPYLVFETGLPVRFYLPREDVRGELQPTDKRTFCAYKGEASYPAMDVGGEQRSDLMWSYEHPLRPAADLTDAVAFFNEKVDVIVDGRRWEKPSSALAATIVEEAGV